MRLIKLSFSLSTALTLALLSVPNVHAVNEHASERAKQVLEYWTPARRASAIPRDMFIGDDGQGYIRGRGGRLLPYGGKLKAPILPLAKGGNGGGKGGGNDGGGGSGGGSTSDTNVTYLSPSQSGTEITSVPTPFTANVTDPNGLKSVSFKFQAAGSDTVESTAPSCLEVEARGNQL